MKDLLAQMHAAANTPDADPAKLMSMIQENAVALNQLFFGEKTCVAPDEDDAMNRIVALLLHFMALDAVDQAAEITVTLAQGHLPAIAADGILLFSEATHLDTLSDPDEQECHMELECLWGECNEEPDFAEAFRIALTAAIAKRCATKLRFVTSE